MPPEAPRVALLRPHWPAPPAVAALMSERTGGCSTGPYDSANLGVAVGDAPESVAANRAGFRQALAGARPVWLRQVHGTEVLRLDAGTPDEPATPADAAWTDQPGLACTVQVADCLPVLLADRRGRAVAAAHAGWRGLAAGVLESTLVALRSGAGVDAADVVAWLGPCIGPLAFEVGADVLEAFGSRPGSAEPRLFAFSPRADGAARWRANLHELARRRLGAAGVPAIHADDTCTALTPSRFFSFRRDGRTGRMAAAVWLC